MTEHGVTRTPAVSSTKAVDNAFVKAVGQEMEQIALVSILHDKLVSRDLELG